MINISEKDFNSLNPDMDEISVNNSINSLNQYTEYQKTAINK